MPQAAPIIGLAATGALTGLGVAGTFGIVAGIAAGLGTFALGLAQQFLLTPSRPSLSKDRTDLIRQPITERRFPFGELVLGGVLTEYETIDGSRLHNMIVTLGDAPEAWDSIPIVWLDDTPIFESQLDADGKILSGKFKEIDGDPTYIRKHLGGPDQTADTKLINEIERFDSSFRGVGIAYLYIQINWDASELPNGLPSVRAYCRTNSYLDPRDSTRKFGTNAALITREYLTEPSVGLGFDTADLDDTQSQAAANVCEEIVDARPVGHAVVKVDTSDDELDLAVVGSSAALRIETGDRVEIFTDGTAPGGLATGTSYYAIVTRLVGENIRDGDLLEISLSAANYTGDAATAISDGNVDTKHRSKSDSIHAAVQLAASFDDAMARTPIGITDAGTGQHLVIKTGEPRYAAAGVFEDGRKPKDQIEDVLTSMAGRLIWTGGVFRIVPGAWTTPMAEVFDEGDLWGPLVVRTRHSRRERFNAVRGVHASLLTVGEMTDYPSVIDSTFVTNDGGDRVFRELDLPWTSRAATAQRIAKINLARHRREIRVDYPTSTKGLLSVPGSVVKISNARRSWAEKTFEVIEQADNEISAEVGDQPLQGTMLSLAELDSTAFDFDPLSEETVKAPQPTLRGGNPFEADAPTDLTLNSGESELFVKTDGTVVSRIRVGWVVQDGFAASTEVQFKLSSASAWSAMGLVDEDQTFQHIWDVDDGESYDVRVRTITDLGVRSEWTQAAPHTVIGKTTPPPSVDTFNIAREADGTREFTWTAERPADVRSGGGFQIRFATGTGAIWENMSDLHDGLIATSPWETNQLAAGTYTFGIKMVDSSNNESENARIIEATLGNPRLGEVLVSRDEQQLGWPGDLVDCFITPENTLEAEGLGTWDDLPNTWDALADTWRSIVTNKSPITYTTPEIDLGADVTFTPLVSVNPSSNATVTMQTGSEADGGVVGSFVVPAATTAHYIRIRVSESRSAPYLLSIVTLLDADVQIEDYEDVDTSLASAGVFERIATGHFKLATRGDTASITSATIRAFQNAGSGWTWDLLSKSTTITGGSEPAAEFKIYKDGVLADAVIDAEIRGPAKGDTESTGGGGAGETRLTEGGTTRITEDGTTRETEGA